MMTDTLTREQIEAMRDYFPEPSWYALNSVMIENHRALCDLALIGLAVQPRPLSQILGRAIVVYDHPDFEGQQAKIVARYIGDAWRDSAIGREYAETTLATPISALPRATS